MAEELYSGDVQLAGSTVEYTRHLKTHFNR